MDEAYGRGHLFIGKLQQSCLLEVIRTHVKMHDVIRDLALWIVNGCGKSKCSWIVSSSNSRRVVFEDIEKWSVVERVSIMHDFFDLLLVLPSNSPNLSVFILQSSRIRRFPEEFFQYVKSLTYLDLSHSSGLENLSSSIGVLTQLKHLDLS